VKGTHHVAILSVKAPTLRSCEDLDSVVRSKPAGDKLIILKDFNARVGTDSDRESLEGMTLEN